MSLYNWFITNPFGPGARTIEWIYTDRTGGTPADLDSEPTYGADTSGTQCRLVAYANDTAEIWQLVAGTEATDLVNGWVRPLDFGTGVNEKVWKRLLCFGTGGGGGSLIRVIGETPTGLVNGINVNYSTAFNFMSNTLSVFVNGLRMKPTLDYSETGLNLFQMTQALLTGDLLITDYTRS